MELKLGKGLRDKLGPNYQKYILSTFNCLNKTNQKQNARRNLDSDFQGVEVRYYASRSISIVLHLNSSRVYAM